MGKINYNVALGARHKSSWSADSSKFGREMLEKMGWKKGKGLGREEAGITDPIQLKDNSKSKGLGFVKEDINKFQAVEDCSKILAKLNSDMGLTPSDTEEKSLVIRGKVVTKEEFQSIFGLAKEEEEQEETEEEPLDAVVPDSTETTSDKTFVSTQSSVDYFKQKFAERLAKLGGSKVPPPKVEEDNQTEPEEEEPLSQLATPSRSILTKTPKKFVYTDGALESSGKKIRFNKHVSLLHVDLKEGTYQELVYPHRRDTKVMQRFREFNKENSSPQVEEEEDSVKPKKKKKRKKTQELSQNPGSPELPVKLSVEEEGTSSKKKKKRLKKKLEELEDIEESPTLSRIKRKLEELGDIEESPTLSKKPKF